MKSALLFLLSAFAIVCTAVFTILDLPVHTLVCAGIALLALIFAYRATVLPMRTIRAGMDLLRSQDFASRLRSVGQKEADEVVQLYNTIMANMKAERLRNLEQDNFLAKLVEASPMGIAVCNLDGAIEQTNKAFNALSSPLLLETLDALPEGGECTIRPGAAQVLRCSRRYFMDRGFHRTFYLVERLTDEIVRAETAMFHKIVRTMGHEVNNTLGGVVSVLETMTDIHSEDQDVCEALRSCRTSCINLGDFVKGYSDVVKLPEANLDAVNLNDFVLASVPFLSELCHSSVELATDLDSQAVNVSADTMLLQRVLVNTVKNAVESIGDRPGRITLRTSPRTLEIIDNGRGISPEDAKRIFTPFFSTKRADRGLGLMLIADILRKHKAAFSLSTGADGLTTFKITFPHN